MISSQYWAPSLPLKMRYRLHDFDMPGSSGLYDNLHIFLLLLGYVAIIFYHTQHQVPIYQEKFHKRKMYLYIHIFTGITEATKYRLRESVLGHLNPLPNALDVFSCFVWSWTSLELVKTLRRGDPRTTRPPYQAGACLRPVISLISYLAGIPSLHRVSISALDSFIWARLGIFFFSYTPYIRSSRASTIYAISIPLSAVIAIHESRVPGASVAYIFAAAYIKGLNDWVTQQSRYIRESEDSSKIPSSTKTLVSILLKMGFAEVEELRAVVKMDELVKPVADVYVSTKYSIVE